MNIKEFIQNFSDQFEDLGDVKLMPTTIFRELEEWGSLEAMMVIAMIDEQYGVTISGEDIKKSQTIQDIFDAVSRKL